MSDCAVAFESWGTTMAKCEMDLYIRCVYIHRNAKERERERGHMSTGKDKISHILLRTHSAMQWRERERERVKI